jgi:CRP-like cAMP-binding protein
MISMEEKISFLENVSAFRCLQDEHLKTLAKLCTEKIFAQGDVIFRQGDMNSGLYIVVEGQVILERELDDQEDSLSMNVVKPQASFGEMALFYDAPCSVSATALQTTRLLYIENDDFLAFASQYPDLLLKLNRVLSQRLIEAYDKISELMRLRKPRELRNLYDKLDF